MHQYTTLTKRSKKVETTYPSCIKTKKSAKYQYLVGITREENLGVPHSLFGPMPTVGPVYNEWGELTASYGHVNQV